MPRLKTDMGQTIEPRLTFLPPLSPARPNESCTGLAPSAARSFYYPSRLFALAAAKGFAANLAHGCESSLEPSASRQLYTQALRFQAFAVRSGLG